MSSLIPDREMLAQFAGLMFKHARPDGFVSLRLFPDKGSKKEKPIDIEPIRIDDKDFLNVTVIRATQAATWHEPAVFCPPVATFLTSKNAKTDNLCEGPCLSVECDQRPREARPTLEALLGPATAVVESGGEWTNPATGEIEPKVHLHWRLKKPTATKTEHDLLREARDTGDQAGRRRRHQQVDRSSDPLAGELASQEHATACEDRCILRRQRDRSQRSGRASTRRVRHRHLHRLRFRLQQNGRQSSKPTITRP